MRVMKTNVYEFKELSEGGQTRAVDEINELADFQQEYNEAEETVKQFELNSFKPDCELKGLRLRKWILNNWGEWLYKGKCFSLWSKTDIPFNKHHGKPFPKLKDRRSKIMFESSYVLTGVYYDNEFLKPVYEFAENYNEKCSKIGIEELISNCYQNLKNAIEREIEARQTKEYVKADCEANGYEFTEDGVLI